MSRYNVIIESVDADDVYWRAGSEFRVYSRCHAYIYTGEPLEPTELFVRVKGMPDSEERIVIAVKEYRWLYTHKLSITEDKFASFQLILEVGHNDIVKNTKVFTVNIIPPIEVQVDNVVYHPPYISGHPFTGIPSHAFSYLRLIIRVYVIAGTEKMRVFCRVKIGDIESTGESEEPLGIGEKFYYGGTFYKFDEFYDSHLTLTVRTGFITPDGIIGVIQDEVVRGVEVVRSTGVISNQIMKLVCDKESIKGKAGESLHLTALCRVIGAEGDANYTWIKILETPWSPTYSSIPLKSGMEMEHNLLYVLENDITEDLVLNIVAGHYDYGTGELIEDFRVPVTIKVVVPCFVIKSFDLPIERWADAPITGNVSCCNTGYAGLCNLFIHTLWDNKLFGCTPLSVERDKLVTFEIPEGLIVMPNEDAMVVMMGAHEDESGELEVNDKRWKIDDQKSH